MGWGWPGYMHEFINEMLLIVVIEANGSVEIIITCDSNYNLVLVFV